MPYTTPDGIPFRGDPGILTPEEAAALPLKGDYHCRTFDLTTPEDLKDYHEVKQGVIDGHTVILKELFQDHRSRNGWVIMLQWLDLYVLPPQAHWRSTVPTAT